MKKTVIYQVLQRARITVEPHEGRPPRSGAHPWALRAYPQKVTKEEGKKLIEELEADRAEVVEVLDALLAAHSSLWESWKSIGEAQAHYRKMMAGDQEDHTP